MKCIIVIDSQQLSLRQIVCSEDRRRRLVKVCGLSAGADLVDIERSFGLEAT